MTFPSSWLMGSILLTTSADITVGGVPVTIPPGEYYLDDPSDPLSLRAAVLTAVTPQMTLPGIYIARDRKIRISDSAPTTWTAIDSRLQDAIGLGASFGPTTLHTAAEISTLLWSPGWCATTTGHPSATTGFETAQRVHTSSQSGLTTRTTVQGTSRRQCALSWAQVLRDRAWTETYDDGKPGDFRRWWRDVLVTGRRWKWHTNVAESATVDSTAAVISSPLGPYVSPVIGDAWWERSVANADTHSDVSLDGVLASEIVP